MRIAIRIEDEAWRVVADLERLVRRAARSALAVAPDARRAHGELGVLLASDAAVRALNRDFRGRNRPTNVLSFPAPAPFSANGSGTLGDVVLASGVVAAEARRQGKPVEAHLCHLVVHGILHLLGYDHDAAGRARQMEALEVAALARLGIADPYAVPEDAG